MRTHLRQSRQRPARHYKRLPGARRRRRRGLGTLSRQGRDSGGPSAPAPPRGRVSRGTACSEGNCRPRGSRAAGAAGGPMSRRCPRRARPGRRPPCFCSLFFFAFPSFRPFPQNTTFPPFFPLPFLLRGRWKGRGEGGVRGRSRPARATPPWLGSAQWLTHAPRLEPSLALRPRPCSLCRA